MKASKKRGRALFRSGGRKARVLIASVEPTFSQLFGVMIREVTGGQCRIFECHVGVEIQILARNHPFDLFIAVMNNIMFPSVAVLREKPWERSVMLIEELKRCHGMPVIAYCGLGPKDGGDVWLSEAKTAGADFAFSLPWDAVSFRAAVLSCLGGGTLPSGITVRS